MKTSVAFYLALGLFAFLVATTGSDLFARLTIGDETLGHALTDHFYWAGAQFIGTLLLLLPFEFLAVIGSWIEEKSSRLNGLIIFGLPALYLVYSYFEGYQASKLTDLDHRWTAATLSIGFLPFAAVPVVLFAWLAGLIVLRLSRRAPDRE
jgi:hypothetical protein